MLHSALPGWSSAALVGGWPLSNPLSRSAAPRPEGPYAQSKWEAEQLVREAGAKHGQETGIVRPPLVCGPGVKGIFLRLFSLPPAAWALAARMTGAADTWQRVSQSPRVDAPHNRTLLQHGRGPGAGGALAAGAQCGGSVNGNDNRASDRNG